MKAMACGLPCSVVDNGGIREYVTEETGFTIAPMSREHVVAELAEKIKTLVLDSGLRQQMSACAVEQARQYEWGHKAEMLLHVYRQVLSETKKPASV